MGVRFSTGCVGVYVASGCDGPDLPESAPEGGAFRSWYLLSRAGHQLVSRWNDGEVWGSDFRDADGGDLESQGGADLPDLYFFSGHGNCDTSPTPTSQDFLYTCGQYGKPDTIKMRIASRFGNGAGRLCFFFIDASCPIKLESLTN